MNRLPLRLLPILLLGFSFASLAVAKPVSLKWDAIEGAGSYEIQIELQGKPVLNKKIEEAGWKGELESGVYVYRVRGVDQVGRPGEWSQANPLVVLPKAPPVPLSPKSGETIAIFPSQDLRLEWTLIPGATRYEIELRKGGDLVSNFTTPETEIKISGLVAGSYQWRVKPLFEPGKLYPHLQGKKWDGDFSPPQKLTISNRILSKPGNLSPSGGQWPRSTGRMEFKWNPVEGAEGYEIHLTRKRLEAGTAPVSQLYKDRVFMSETPFIELQTGNEGSYTWKVRALAAIDSKKMEGRIRSPEAEENFWFLLDQQKTWESGWFQLSARFGLLTATMADQDRNLAANLSTSSLSLQVRMERPMGSDWYLALELRPEVLTLSEQQKLLLQAQASLKYRLTLNHGWYLGVLGGVQLRQLPDFSYDSSTGTTNALSYTDLGAPLGFDLTKHFTEKTNFRLGAAIFYPMTVLTTVQGKLPLKAGALESRTIEGTLTYWHHQNLGLLFGLASTTQSGGYFAPGAQVGRSLGISGWIFSSGLVLRLQ